MEKQHQHENKIIKTPQNQQTLTPSPIQPPPPTNLFIYYYYYIIFLISFNLKIFSIINYNNFLFTKFINS